MHQDALFKVYMCIYLFFICVSYLGLQYVGRDGGKAKAAESAGEAEQLRQHSGVCKRPPPEKSSEN